MKLFRNVGQLTGSWMAYNKCMNIYIYIIWTLSCVVLYANIYITTYVRTFENRALLSAVSSRHLTRSASDLNGIRSLRSAWGRLLVMAMLS